MTMIASWHAHQWQLLWSMPSWFVTVLTQTVCLFVVTVTLYEVSSVLEAFVLTLAVTAGLTAYTFQTKRDFTVHYGWWVLSEVLCSCNHWCIAAKSPDSSRWMLSCRHAHFKLNTPGCKLAESTQKMQIFLWAGFIRFYKYLCNRSSLLLSIWTAQWRREKGWLMK